MPYTFVSRAPEDWHEPDRLGWLFSAAFVDFTDEQVPQIATFVARAYDAGLAVAQIVFSGPVMKLYLDFADCSERGRERIELACDLFDALDREVPLRDVIFHHGVHATEAPLDMVGAAPIFAPYGPQRPVDPNAVQWAPNQALKALLGF